MKTANDLGISQSKVAELHSQYFESLVGLAWEDGVLTESEIGDLSRVADLLGIDAAELANATQPREKTDAPEHAPGTAQRSFLEPGDLVVLTGDMSQPRNSIEAQLAAAGFKSHGAITKKVKLLVAADPDSLSGKARKARDYGIPVVGEEYLWSHVLTR